MYVIGLTGNIATGKSTVASMLKELGAYVLDADDLTHGAMRAGTAVQQRIVARFGREMLLADGEIDRRRLGAVVFADPDALRDLERIVHPAVIAETLRLLAASDRPVGVIEAIKLLEADMRRYCSALWVVTADHHIQVERLVRTRSLTVAQAEARMAAQPPAEEKVALADVVIDNSGALEDTRAQVLRAWQAIPGIAASNPPGGSTSGRVIDSSEGGESLRIRSRLSSASIHAWLVGSSLPWAWWSSSCGPHMARD